MFRFAARWPAHHAGRLPKARVGSNRESDPARLPIRPHTGPLNERPDNGERGYCKPSRQDVKRLSTPVQTAPGARREVRPNFRATAFSSSPCTQGEDGGGGSSQVVLPFRSRDRRHSNRAPPNPALFERERRGVQPQSRRPAYRERGSRGGLAGVYTRPEMRRSAKSCCCQRFIPSTGTPAFGPEAQARRGEGLGEGVFVTAPQSKNPHRDPLPEYRARGKERVAVCVRQPAFPGLLPSICGARFPGVLRASVRFLPPAQRNFLLAFSHQFGYCSVFVSFCVNTLCPKEAPVPTKDQMLIARRQLDPSKPPITPPPPPAPTRPPPLPPT